MRLFFICALFFILSPVFSQEFGGSPASVKWNAINTDTVKLIFPSGLDSLAARIAGITTEEQKKYVSSIENRLKKVSIVLRPQTVISNGYVALSPWRSEFYLTPEQNAFELGAMSWSDLLSIHEYRHVEQYNNFNVGLSKFLHILFGQNGQALANAAAVPDWFFEGDAVYNETRLSRQGRGRLPLFFNGYKSLSMANKDYSYMKLRNGSYRDFVPDHYPLGYMLVAYGYEKYGNDFWKNVTHQAASYHYLFYPLQNSVKENAKISFKEFVHNAFEFYNRQWNKDSLSNIHIINSIKEGNVVDEKYPYATNDGSIIYLRKSFKDVPAFILQRANGSKEKIAIQSICDDDYFSYNDGKIVYASFKQDARWGNKEYNEIRMIDVESKKEKKLSSGTRYFSPDISHDGKWVVTVEQDIDGSSKLVLLDTNGAIKKVVCNDRNHIFSYPKFSVDDKKIFVCLRNSIGEMSIIKQNIDTNTADTIIPFKNRVIGFLNVQGDTLIYSCSNNGRDEIWGYINVENKSYRLASAATGLYQGFIRNNSITASAFTANGYRLASIKPVWQQVNASDTLKDLFVTKPFHSSSNHFLSVVSQRNYQVAKYSRFSGFFNFHSYNPSFSDPDYSFIVYGQNVLNTVQSQLYYTYNRNERFSRIGYTGIYGGWYLQPFMDVNETFNRSLQYNQDTTFHWNETRLAAGFQLPLNFSGGKLHRNLNLSAGYNFLHLQWTGLSKQLLRNSGFSFGQFLVKYSQYTQQASQNIYPHFGQTLTLQYRTGSTAHQFLANGNFYFPGFAKSHSIVIGVAFQARDTSGKYYYDNNFPFSRGYSSVDFPRMIKYAVNYNFPIAYPDWGFGNIVYFLRIRTNLFYDVTQVKSLRSGNRYNYASTGVEVFFDTRWWNQQPISIGVRYSRLLNTENTYSSPNQWQVILPLNLF
ncbi:MAG: hypothetical protein JST21_04820 [Bacteroidetes bacterium]|nr:hypothetical protein [Bacteroidota bacterium]